MKDKELERKEVLLEREIQLLADKVEKLEGQLDRLDVVELELKALRVYLGTAQPETIKMLEDVREKVLREGPPAGKV